MDCLSLSYCHWFIVTYYTKRENKYTSGTFLRAEVYIGIMSLTWGVSISNLLTDYGRSLLLSDVFPGSVQVKGQMKKAIRERLFKKLPWGKKYFVVFWKYSILFWYIFRLLYFVAYFDAFLRWVFCILFGNTLIYLCPSLPTDNMNSAIFDKHHPICM